MQNTERDARIATITECVNALLPEWQNLAIKAEKLRKQRDVLSRELEQLIAEARTLGAME